MSVATQRSADFMDHPLTFEGGWRSQAMPPDVGALHKYIGRAMPTGSLDPSQRQAGGTECQIEAHGALERDWLQRYRIA